MRRVREREMAVLVGSGVVLFVLARRFARKWEYA